MHHLDQYTLPRLVAAPNRLAGERRERAVSNEPTQRERPDARPIETVERLADRDELDRPGRQFQVFGPLHAPIDVRNAEPNRLAAADLDHLGFEVDRNHALEMTRHRDRNAARSAGEVDQHAAARRRSRSQRCQEFVRVRRTVAQVVLRGACERRRRLEVSVQHVATSIVFNNSAGTRNSNSCDTVSITALSRINCAVTL